MKNKFLYCFFVLNILFTPFCISQENECVNCDVLPGQLDNFKAALTDSKVHYYTNGGTTKLDLKKAEEVCDVNYFTTCNNLLVLISTGKKNDRTEIRQDKNLSLNQYSAMDFSAIYENVPSSNSKKGVTIGQIHNDTKGVKRPLLRVEIAGGNEVRVIVTSSYLKGEGKTENNFFTSFKEKDQLDCKIEINEADNNVTVIIKNNTTGKSEQKSYNVSKLWQEMDGEFYFKAGAYTQVDGPKTKVSYSKFQFLY
ncbi:Alginate lyase [Polaribacter sp. KT25b]|uniref:polysaccharide lyase family 7 protein n=1 Tax=Polaribacter sp. KT25b TaxID=1855336 RepID=UPI00087D6DFC|nr:polysaccharide lyase family 7 protein [Polaribacter sp. KT25b]SDR71166.1 Alginate lyase [Polaribacter sp. KT25b]